MTTPQLVLFGILGAALVLFFWGRWRVDVVAVGALLAAVATGLVPGSEAFYGFGHPAVMTVAAVLAISAALERSGVVDLVVRRVTAATQSRAGQTTALSLFGGFISGFMNNVGALALLLPAGISTARKTGYSPSLLLMPLSFATILGGLTTLVGTPPNIIVSGFRRDAMGRGFALFDFAWVGVPLAAAGIAFLVLVGWRLIPRGRKAGGGGEPFEISDYVTEMRVKEGAKVAGRTLAQVQEGAGVEFNVLQLIRNGWRYPGLLHRITLREGDVLLVKADATAIQALVDQEGVELVEASKMLEELEAADLAVAEAVVTPLSWLAGRSPRSLRLRNLFGVNLLALSRKGQQIRTRLRDVRLEPGDVLLLQGEADSLGQSVSRLGCLPLAERGLTLQPRRALVPLAVFAAAIAAIAFGILPAAIALVMAVLVMVLAGVLSPADVYESIDWQVVVLLGALIPVGGALETTGAAAWIAARIGELARALSPHLVIAAILVVTMTLSDLMNNAATAVVMAPIAIGVGRELGLSPDPFLMAVAVGASCAFLTPIGHQNNVLVMGPGGYRFGDYWRVGLPLEILLVLLAVPLIPWAWPFTP
ncbi:MAG: SLC13 family permease [Deferrisomatales bacterium]|nr:SLC13 family permease [Deferrisomatales bacterium]